MLADSDHADIESESGRARSLPRAGLHSRGRRRMRGDRSSTAPAPPRKRRCARTRQAANESEHNFEDKAEEPDAAVTEMQLIRYDEIPSWYDRVFRSLKQLCCKDILKAWIRHAHPRKQTRCPYNGGKRKDESIRIMNYPGHCTMPDYWLSDVNWEKNEGVRHTEPDRLDKDGQSVR